MIVVIMSALPFTASSQVFKKGDTVCFVGNSITNHGGFHHDVALFYATRYPSERIYVINSGVSGNRAAHVLNRMDSDVLVNHPRWAIIKLGMNDVEKDLYTEAAWQRPGIEAERGVAFSTFQKDYETLIKRLQANNCKIMLQTPSIYDETALIPGSEQLRGRNTALGRYAAFVKELAAKYHLPVVDYWSIMDAITRKIQVKDSTATIIGSDRVHPGPVGHFIMAYQFLKTTGVASEVSSVQITVSKGRCKASAKNAAIGSLQGGPGGISFTLLEKALPFPVPKEAQDALELVPFGSELNREGLLVKGLPAGTYELIIDDKQVGSYRSEDLGKGIDLSGNALTPQYVQAQRVLKAFEAYWKLEARYRYMKGMEMGRLQGRKIYDLAGARTYFKTAVAASKDTTTAAYKDLVSFRDTYLPIKENESGLLKEMKEMQDLIYREAQPTTHYFKIRKN